MNSLCSDAGLIPVQKIQIGYLSYISRLSENKNLEFAIDVILQLKSEITFEIWGIIDNPAYYQKCINKLNKTPSNITWSYNGSLPIGKSIEKFRDSDLFIFPTLGENYGYVILESLLSGCPVILSKGTTPWEDLNEAEAGKNIPLSNIIEWIQQTDSFLKLSDSELSHIIHKTMPLTKIVVARDIPSYYDPHTIIHTRNSHKKKIIYT